MGMKACWLIFKVCLQVHMSALGVWKCAFRCGVLLLKVSWICCVYILN